MRFYIIISIFLSLEYASSTYQNFDSNSDCLTDELYGDFTDEEYNNLVNKRKFVRTRLQNQLYRNETDTLFVPIVFHNLYKVVNGIAIGSYCDFGFDDDEIVEGNDQDICNDRIARSLEVLNAQYAPIAIQFSLHSEYSEMVHATDLGFDGFYLDATGGTSTVPSPNGIKEYYNIPNALNIYTHECLPSSTTSCNTSKTGFSTYPWSLDDNYPGVFIRHKALPGSSDKYSPAENSGVGILAHEIGHFFSLLHINGIWFLREGNTQRELVSGADCDVHGDLICDTPGSPGYVPLSIDPDSSWYFNTINRECIYHGYGGHYNHESDILKIGGYNFSFDHSDLPDYNYCDLWGFEDYYGLNNNCDVFTNYDNMGDFFGTKDLPEEECLNEDKSEYASECDIDNYNHLPKGNNFMQAGTTTLASCAPRPIGHADYDESNHGFTTEQFENIRTSLELDYTLCTAQGACNEGSSIQQGINTNYLLRSDTTSCYYGSNISPNANDCFVKGECVYGCEVEMASINENVIPQNFGIYQIYPNPFNPVTTIQYGLNQNVNIQGSIYDINGRLITTLINEFQIAGYHSITWNASNFSSGIYFLKMSSEKFTITQKLVLIK